MPRRARIQGERQGVHGDDRDQDGEHHRQHPAPGSAPACSRACNSGPSGCPGDGGGRQVGEQPAQVPVGLGSSRPDAEPLARTRPGRAVRVPVVRGQQVCAPRRVRRRTSGGRRSCRGGGWRPGTMGGSVALTSACTRRQRAREDRDSMRSLAMDCGAPSSGISSQPAT